METAEQQEILDLTLLRDSINEAYKKAVPNEEEREIGAGLFLISLYAGCKQTPVDVWKNYITGDPGIQLRSKITETYTKGAPEGNSEKIFQVVERNSCLTKFCCLLLVKLYDARTFNHDDPIDNYRRRLVLGEDIIRGYKKLKGELGHPVWDQRIVLPGNTGIKFFQFCNPDGKTQMFLDLSDEEIDENPVLSLKMDPREVYATKKMSFFEKDKDRLEKGRAELHTQVETLENQVKKNYVWYTSTSENKNAHVAVREYKDSLKTFQGNSTTTSMKKCFNNLKHFLNNCEDKDVTDSGRILTDLVTKGITNVLSARDQAEKNAHSESTFLAAEGAPKLSPLDTSNSNMTEIKQRKIIDSLVENSAVVEQDVTDEGESSNNLKSTLEVPNNPEVLTTSTPSPIGSQLGPRENDIVQVSINAAQIDETIAIHQHKSDTTGTHLSESLQGESVESDENEDEDEDDTFENDSA